MTAPRWIRFDDLAVAEMGFHRFFVDVFGDLFYACGRCVRVFLLVDFYAAILGGEF